MCTCMYMLPRVYPPILTLLLVWPAAGAPLHKATYSNVLELPVACQMYQLFSHIIISWDKDITTFATILVIK